MLYRGFDKAALDAAYNNTKAVGPGRRDRYIADWAKRTAALVERTAARTDLRYGAAPRQRIDFFPCGKVGAPTLLFIHGGYWQFSDKENYGFLAAGPLAHAINVALVEYTLAPANRMDGIVREIRSAIAWLVAHLGELGAATDGIYLAGHSAGGHLTAMTITEPGIKGALPISGLFDLEPIRLGALNDKLGMDAAEAERNSPLLHIPAEAPPMTLAVGGDELPELRRQSADYHAAWVGRGLTGRHLLIAGCDHFSILEEFAAPEGRLTTALVELVAAVG